jgi:hypothetical protein
MKTFGVFPDLTRLSDVHSRRGFEPGARYAGARVAAFARLGTRHVVLGPAALRLGCAARIRDAGATSSSSYVLLLSLEMCDTNVYEA